MSQVRQSGPARSTSPWPLVLGLVGVDYFSTLAYLPSIAVDAAGALAPIAAGAVVLVTFLLALPVYWYVVGRAGDGRGAIGLLEDRIPGWRGKLVVLTLLGFAAADFVITRSLSVADAAIHLIHNPHGQRLLARLPADLDLDHQALWPPLRYLTERLIEPQVAITLCLSMALMAAWLLLKRGITRLILFVTAAAVVCYLALVTLIIASGVAHLVEHPELFQSWADAVFAGPAPMEDAPAGDTDWIWAWLGIALWSFPQMALGLSGFEMILTVVTRVRGARPTRPRGEFAIPAN